MQDTVVEHECGLDGCIDTGDGVTPVVEISMEQDSYSRAAYLYACVAAKEVSDRAYRLTAQVCAFPPTSLQGVCECSVVRWRTYADTHHVLRPKHVVLA